MSGCPDRLTWQAVVDGEERDARLTAHLDSCPACRRVYREIREAAALAGFLANGAALPPGFSAAVLAKTRPFPAGMVAAALFCLLLLSARLMGGGGLTWWLTVGITRQCGLLMDALFNLLYVGLNLGPLFWLAAALLLAALELVVLSKLKLIKE